MSRVDRHLPATILQFPHRLTWERRDLDMTADAFSPAGFYLGCYLVAHPGAGIHWNVTYRGPEQGAAVEDCGFATTLAAAQAIAESHWRGLSHV
jgi:hypothetical protein